MATLCDSFYVGGHYIEGPGGHHMTGQMYVKRYGSKKEGQPAVIYIHGAAQTGTHFEVTPDGRPGIAVLQASQGWECYVVDQPGIGRSRYHATDLGELTHYTAENLQGAFTSPSPEAWPQAKLHSQWPGTGKLGDPIFEQFYASQVGHIADYRIVEKLFRDAARALLERTGPAFLVTHSQSGPIGWHVADECPDLVRGIVALEPNGPPYIFPEYPHHNSTAQRIGTLMRPFGITSISLHYDPPLASNAEILPFHRVSREVGIEGRVTQEALQISPPRQLINLRAMPVVVVTAEASYHATYDHITAQFLREASVAVEHIYLEDEGIHGNGHLMAVEKNNDEIQAFMNRWFNKVLEGKSANKE